MIRTVSQDGGYLRSDFSLWKKKKDGLITVTTAMVVITTLILKIGESPNRNTLNRNEIDS